MEHTSHIELSKSALRNNIRFIRKRIPEGTTLFSVIKGNAYGHGIEHLVPLLVEAGARHLAVFDASEAFRAQEAATAPTEIMIMGHIDLNDIRWAVEQNIQCYVFDPDRLEALIDVARSTGRPARIHLDLETGFYRIGLAESDLQQVINLIQNNRQHVVLEGVCTHYAGAENISNYQRITEQIERFGALRQRLEREQVIPQRYHSACSAAAINYPRTTMDMVRIGIMHYGYWPSRETYAGYLQNNPIDRNPLRRVISWKSKVMAIKDVPANEYIGYGLSYRTGQPTRIAVVPVGYSYGYNRSLSNLGRVLIGGKRLPVIGIINMNMLTVNINEAPEVGIGDEVVLIGSQKKLSISVASFSELSNQLNYELLTRLPTKIPRIVVT